ARHPPLTSFPTRRSSDLERPIAELSGTVLTMDGQPAAGVKVWLEYEGGKGVQTRTGLRGEFAWADVPSGPATVLAEGRSEQGAADRKSTRLNSSHVKISY